MKNSQTKELMIEYLFSGKSISDTAKELNVSRTFIYDQLKEPEIIARFNQLQSDLRKDVDNRLIALYSKATDTIESILDSDNDQMKFKAAMFLLEKLDKLKIGSTNPVEIEEEQEQAEKKAEFFKSLNPY